MAIKINNTTVIYDDTSTDFYFVNPGAYTKAELASLTGDTVGSFVFCSDAGSGAVGKIVHWDGSKWTNISSLDASNSDFTSEPGNGYKYYTFVNPGRLVVNTGGVADVLVVGGGGGTGPFSDSRNGGAGGGGVCYWPGVELPVGGYNIQVGARSGGNNGEQGNGYPSIFGAANPTYEVTALGGGGGGGGPRPSQVPAGDGGSGGGGSGFDSNTPSGTSTQAGQNQGRIGLLQYGNPGGPEAGFAEGGGGAGEPGYPSSPSSSKQGRGGNGVQIIGFDISADLQIPGATANNSYFGGGGNGNSAAQSDIRPLGGGGTSQQNNPGEPGLDYTGGGAGGGGAGGSGPGKYGGQGLVVVRVLV